jgi:hypothetical protein
MEEMKERGGIIDFNFVLMIPIAKRLGMQQSAISSWPLMAVHDSTTL